MPDTQPLYYKRKTRVKQYHDIQKRKAEFNDIIAGVPEKLAEILKIPSEFRLNFCSSISAEMGSYHWENTTVKPISATGGKIKAKARLIAEAASLLLKELNNVDPLTEIAFNESIKTEHAFVERQRHGLFQMLWRGQDSEGHMIQRNIKSHIEALKLVSEITIANTPDSKPGKKFVLEQKYSRRFYTVFFVFQPDFNSLIDKKSGLSSSVCDAFDIIFKALDIDTEQGSTDPRGTSFTKNMRICHRQLIEKYRL